MEYRQRKIDQAGKPQISVISKSPSIFSKFRFGLDLAAEERITKKISKNGSVTVAVVIAFYNGAEFIERAIASALNQSHPISDLIVVDDGSRESESKKLLELKEVYNFEIFKIRNSGQSGARNYGVSQTRADFICFLDQDDYFFVNHVEDLLADWDWNDPKLAFTYGDLWRETVEGLTVDHSCVEIEKTHPYKSIHELIRHNMNILPSASLIKRQTFLAVGGFDVQFRGYEDDDLFLRMFAQGYSCRFVPKAVTSWTINENSTSYSESMGRSRFLYFKKLLKSFPEKSIPGVKIFTDLLVPRFALQFAADVIDAALRKPDSFAERKQRLREFRSIFKSRFRGTAGSKLKFMFITWPLANLNASTVRLLLTVAPFFSGVFKMFGIHGVREFLDRYSSEAS